MSEENIVIVEVKPPIPTHKWDFCAYLEGTEEDGLFGWGDSEESAREDLGILLEDYLEGGVASDDELIEKLGGIG